MSYKTDELKIYNKIDSLARKGKDGIFDYYIYIDQLVDNSQYSILENVLIDYYFIDAKKYESVQDLKKDTFHLIREVTTSTIQKQLKKLFDSLGVYQIGFHFFNSSSNKYLGDIKEFDTKTNWDFYNNDELRESLDERETGQQASFSYIALEITCGLMESIIESVPSFSTDKQRSITYQVGSQVIWNGVFKQCVDSYIWPTLLITPDNNSYWSTISCTYSKTYIVDTSTQTTLSNKYQRAISTISSYPYTLS